MMTETLGMKAAGGIARNRKKDEDLGQTTMRVVFIPVCSAALVLVTHIKGSMPH